MRNVLSILVVCLLIAAPLARPQAAGQTRAASGGRQDTASGSQGLVVSGTAAATAAGLKMLEQGGNAADAGAATLLALSVTTLGLFCIGGEVPLLVYSANTKDVKVLSDRAARRSTRRPSSGTSRTAFRAAGM